MIQRVVIPRRRMVVLGKKRQDLERATHTQLSVSGTEAVIEGEAEGVLTATNVVKAIGRGFSAAKAFLLLDEECQLHVISLQGETEKTITRLMSRVIGRQGKAKKTIERLTGAHLCIRGKTVAVLGESEAVERAAGAVDDLLDGRKHSYVYAKLEKMNRV